MSVSQGANTNIFITFTNGLLLELTQNGIEHHRFQHHCPDWRGRSGSPPGIAWRNDGVLAREKATRERTLFTRCLPWRIPFLSRTCQPRPRRTGWTATRALSPSISPPGWRGRRTANWWWRTAATMQCAGLMPAGASARFTESIPNSGARIAVVPGGTVCGMGGWHRRSLHQQRLGTHTGERCHCSQRQYLCIRTQLRFVAASTGSGRAAADFHQRRRWHEHQHDCGGSARFWAGVRILSAVPDHHGDEHRPGRFLHDRDGTTPTTTNSPMVGNTAFNARPDNAYIGSFLWCNSQHDLSFLQMISANGTQTSVVATGQTSPVNQIGFPAGALAGVGSTAVVPLVINLQAGETLQSALQFRVEVNPTAPATPPISALTLLPASTNDFLSLVGPAQANLPVAYQTFAYTTTSNNGQGLVISAAGNNTGLSVQNFAAAALLEIPIPHQHDRIARPAYLSAHGALSLRHLGWRGERSRAGSDGEPDADHFQPPILQRGFLALGAGYSAGAVWQRSAGQQRCQQCPDGFRRHPGAIPVHRRLQCDGCLPRSGLR